MFPPKFSSFALTAAFALASSLSLSACTDDTVDDAGLDDDAGTDTGETGNDTGANAEAVPARGITITEVEANQGTAVLIGQNGEWVGAEGRNAFMIRDRDTLIRLQHTVDPNWVPREITGVLHLETEDGEELEPRTRTFMVEADSDPRNLNTEFYFSVIASEAQPGLKYWVELLETDDGSAASDLPEAINVTPEDYRLVGYELTPLEMKVMLVPIDYTFIGTLVEPTEADLQLFHDELLQQNPLQTIDMQVHAPHTYDNQITNLGQLLSPMTALRNNEGADPNVYYHAIVDVNGPSVNMVAGIASLTGDGKAEGYNRVAATVWFKQSEDIPPGGSAGTFVHEVGHNQGLSHVYCPNAATEAAGPDPSYPHEGGKIGVFGFGIRNFRLYTPTAAHDYMTYCGNSWVSDWTWNKTYKRIQTLTSWDYEDAGGADAQADYEPLLVGSLFPDGSEDWWVLMGPAPSPEQLGAEQRLVYSGDGVVLDEVHSSVSTLSDGETVVVAAPLTVPLSEIEEIARVDWKAETHSVELGSVQIDQSLDLDYR